MNRQRHHSSPEAYKLYYLNQAQQRGAGSSTPFFAGKLFQRGYGHIQTGGGLGNFFGSLFRRALPFLKSAGKQVGQAALKTGANVLNDTLSGNDLKTSLQNRIRETGTELKEEAANKLKGVLNSQTGSGRKRRRRKATPLNKQKKRKTSKQRQSKTKKYIRPKKKNQSFSSRKIGNRVTFQDIFGSSR